MSDIDMMLENVEATPSDGLLADLAQTNEDFAKLDADIDGILESLEREEHEAANPPVDKKYKIDKAALYASQETTIVTPHDDDSKPVVTVRKGKGKSAKKAAAEPDQADAPKERKARAKKEAAPKEPKEPKAPTPAKVDKNDYTGLKTLGYDDGELEALLAIRDGIVATKIRDKATNLLRFLCGREHLSNYTRLVFETLRDNGPMTVPAIVKVMEGRYSAGTSRSQAQQVASLFLAFGIAFKDGNQLTLSSSSRLLEGLRTRLPGK